MFPILYNSEELATILYRDRTDSDHSARLALTMAFFVSWGWWQRWWQKWLTIPCFSGKSVLFRRPHYSGTLTRWPSKARCCTVAEVNYASSLDGFCSSSLLNRYLCLELEIWIECRTSVSDSKCQPVPQSQWQVSYWSVVSEEFFQMSFLQVFSDWYL